MIYLIMASCLIFTLLNYKISGNDLINPSVVFPLIFLAQSIMCILVGNYLDLTFHLETFIILLSSCFIFTAFTFWYYAKRQRNILNESKNIKKCSRKLRYIKLPQILTIGFIIIFIFVLFLKYRYLSQLSAAVGQAGIPLSDRISLYDNLVKFNQVRYQAIGLFLPGYHNLLNILAVAYGYLTTYIVVNNFIVCKKISFFQIITIFLLMLNMYLGGSRSTIFRLITFIAVLYYVLTLRKGNNFKINRRIQGKLIFWGFIVLILFIATLEIFGRSTTTNLFHYLFIYTGAPLYNLDVFIQTHKLPINQLYFGQQTFFGAYNFILPRIGLPRYFLDLPFVRYSLEYGLGNVYTTFYQFLYDFGYSGIVPLISIIAWYYTGTYTKVRETIPESAVDYRLLIFAFLFNDLIMLFFSNRFYESVLNFSNVLIFATIFLFSSLIFEKSVTFSRVRVKIF